MIDDIVDILDDAPFLTGSHVYGTPHPKSDIDLVVHAPREIVDILLKLPNATGFKAWTSDASNEGSSVRLGEVNLILTHTWNAHEAWRDATARCKKAVV